MQTTAEFYDQEEDYALTAYQAMINDGLDEQDQESVEYAADVLQAESEVYFARQRAMETGHKGFGGRQYQVHGSIQGSLTLEEKRARIQAMKNRTQCRKCGQTGHWSDDPICPKGRGKGKKGTTSSTPSTASTARGSHKSSGRSGKGDKPRTVYFAINEYDEGETSYSGHAYVSRMEIKEQGLNDRFTPRSTNPHAMGSGVSPTTRTSGAVPTSSTSPTTSSGPMPTSVPGLTSVQDDMDEIFQSGKSADELLDEMIAKVNLENATKRKAYLDQFLKTVNDPEDEAWQDAYQERWSEFVPGHPLYNEGDRYNQLRWIENARQGLPRLPIPDAHMQPIPEDVETPDTMSGYAPTTPTPRDDLPDGCPHVNVTRQGSNAYRHVVKCKDCGTVLEDRRKDKPESMVAGDRRTCDHEDKDYRGTTATRWRWTCRICGHKESGEKSPGESGRTASMTPQSSRGDASHRTSPMTPTSPYPGDSAGG